MQMRSYEAARSYFSILGFLSWCVIVLGGIVAIGALVAVGQASRSFGGSPMAGVAGLVPGAGIMFFGFLGLVVVQIGRAGVDSAEYAQQSLKIAREQLEISRQTLEQRDNFKRSFEALQHDKQPVIPAVTTESHGNGTASFEPESGVKEGPRRYEPGEIITYRTKRIRAADNGFVFDWNTYPTLEDAKAKIDEDGGLPPPEVQFSRPAPASIAEDDGAASS